MMGTSRTPRSRAVATEVAAATAPARRSVSTNQFCHLRHEARCSVRFASEAHRLNGCRPLKQRLWNWRTEL